jgi:putative addiction module antidote
MTMRAKIRKVGNSSVMTLTADMLALLDAKEGDTLHVLRADDGSLKLMAYDPDFAELMAIAEDVMDENRDALQALA